MEHRGLSGAGNRSVRDPNVSAHLSEAAEMCKLGVNGGLQLITTYQHCTVTAAKCKV